MLSTQNDLTLSLTVSVQTLESVRRAIHGCDACSSNALIPLTHLLDGLVARLDPDQEYIFDEDVCCPCCSSLLEGDTLVELQGMAGAAAAN